MTHTFAKEPETVPSPWKGHAKAYVVRCSCGWLSRLYVYRSNAIRAQSRHLTKT